MKIKIQELMRVQTKEGKILKVADLVNDDPVERPKIQKYLREIKMSMIWILSSL